MKTWIKLTTGMVVASYGIKMHAMGCLFAQITIYQYESAHIV